MVRVGSTPLWSLEAAGFSILPSPRSPHRRGSLHEPLWRQMMAIKTTTHQQPIYQPIYHASDMIPSASLVFVGFRPRERQRRECTMIFASSKDSSTCLS